MCCAYPNRDVGKIVADEGAALAGNVELAEHPAGRGDIEDRAATAVLDSFLTSLVVLIHEGDPVALTHAIMNAGDLDLQVAEFAPLSTVMLRAGVQARDLLVRRVWDQRYLADPMRVGDLRPLPDRVLDGLIAGVRHVQLATRVVVRREPPGKRRANFGARTCAPCPLKPRCCPTRPRKQLLLASEEELLIAARQALDDPINAEHLRRTRPRIERLLSLLAHRYGARRSRYIGSSKARLQAAWAAALVNLNPIASHLRTVTAWTLGTTLVNSKATRDRGPKQPTPSKTTSSGVF
jgi:Transposase DDE domain